jgi:hypothetical protein
MYTTVTPNYEGFICTSKYSYQLSIGVITMFGGGGLVQA